MKAITAVSATGASVPAIANGRISRQRDGENAEIQMYLTKLRDLVPFMPKNRKLSKLEIIQHVIDYICDLQSELETHPAVNNFDAMGALNEQNNIEQIRSSHQSQQNSISSSPRQPLCVRPSPNTILSSVASQSAVPAQQNSSNPLNSSNFNTELNHLANSHSHTTIDKSHHSDRSQC